MPREREQNRVTPDTLEKLELEPQAQAVDKTIKHVFDEGAYRSKTNVLEGLMGLAQGSMEIEDTLIRKANENMLNAEYKTAEENRKKWSEVSRNVKGMAKFNPYNDDAFRRILAGNITSKKIAELNALPDIERMSETEYQQYVDNNTQELTDEYKKASLDPNDVYYSLDKYDKQKKLFEENYTRKHKEFQYNQLQIARRYNMSQTIGRTLYDFDNFNNMMFAGQQEKGNIDLDNRLVVTNSDNTISTEQSITIGEDNSYVVLPTIIDGKKVSDEEAYEHYKTTGEHLGKFESQETANFYANKLHQRQEFYYGGRDKARAINGIIKQNINTWKNEGTPDKTIAENIVDGLKQFITDSPEKLTTPELQKILSDIRINNQELGEMLSSQEYNLTEFLRQAKRNRYQDRILEHQEKELDMTYAREEAMVEFMKAQIDKPKMTPKQRKELAIELTNKYGLEGVYQLETFNQCINGINALDRLQSTYDDTDYVASLYRKAVNESLTVGDIDYGLSNGLISLNTAHTLYNQVHTQNTKAETDDLKQVSKHITRTKEYLFGNSKLKYKGIIPANKPNYTQQAESELNALVDEYQRTKDYKKFNDDLALFKTRWARQMKYPDMVANKEAIAKYKVRTKLGLKNHTLSPTIIARASKLKDQLKTDIRGRNTIFRIDKTTPKTLSSDRITSLPQSNRRVTINNKKITSQHNGVDLDYYDSAPVYLPASVGKNPEAYVTEVYRGDNGGFGNTVVVYVKGRGYVIYHHLQSAGLPRLYQKVGFATPIGHQGNTGKSTGSHVHVEFLNESGGAVLSKDW